MTTITPFRLATPSGTKFLEVAPDVVAAAMGRPVDPSGRGLVREAVDRFHQVVAEAKQQATAPRADARATPAWRPPAKPRLRGSRKG